MKKYALIILFVTLFTQNVFARELSIRITKVEVAPKTKDISFSEEYGIDAALNYLDTLQSVIKTSSWTGDDDLEVQLAIGFCDKNNNPNYIPDWSSRCRQLIQINEGTFLVRANYSNKPDVFLPANSYSIPFNTESQEIPYEASASVTIKGDAKNLQIYAYDLGFDDEMLSESPIPSQCFSAIIAQEVTHCTITSKGKLTFEFAIDVID
jgi:hypothetical protein